MAPLEVAGTSGAVAILPPLYNSRYDLSVHVLVTCDGAAWVVSDVIEHKYLPTLYIHPVVL